ncbi:MAG: hypothetical protein ACMUHY_00885 [Thermoplasmatota archaeon]
MKTGKPLKSGKKRNCEGRLSLGEGVMTVDCRDCTNMMDLSDRRCFNGLSARIVPGFRGSVVLEGEVHRSYGGAIIEALSSHSGILSDIRGFHMGPGGVKKGLSRLTQRMESDFLRDPLSLERSRDAYEKDIRRILKDRNPPEIERFGSIIEATTIMVRKLERDLSTGR